MTTKRDYSINTRIIFPFKSPPSNLRTASVASVRLANETATRPVCTPDELNKMSVDATGPTTENASAISSEVKFSGTLETITVEVCAQQPGLASDELPKVEPAAPFRVSD